MAFTSFTLRKTSAGLGSYLREDVARLGTRLDKSIRADDYTQAVPVLSTTNTFSANVISTTTIRLEWSLDEALVNEAEIVSGVHPTQLIIVSSRTGEPLSVNDGLTIKNISYNENTFYVDDTPTVAAGKWMYYSLFARYSDGIDYWYELLASLYVQLPINYNSTNSMWKHIPEYYRSLDSAQTPLNSGDTPLHAFIELFGYELDRMRTLVESIPLSNDPSLAVTPALERLAKQVGLEIGLQDLGTTKLRNLLTNIGSLRQRKGTVDSILSYISALSGCQVFYKYEPNAAKKHKFYVYSQRINYVADPIFSYVVDDIKFGTFVKNSTTYYATQQLGASAWGLYSYGTGSMGASVPVVTNIAGEGLTIQMPNGSYGTQTLMLYARKSFPHVDNLQYSTSFDVSMSAGASFNNFHTSLNTTRLSWESGISGSSFPSVVYNDTSWNTSPDFKFGSDNQRYIIDYTASTSASANTYTVVPVLEFQATPGATITVKRWLVEYGYNGTYFDGNTKEGNFIPSNLTNPGAGTFDYFWGDAGDYSDYSYYLFDRNRTVNTVERVINNNIAPVTILDDYEIVWNYYPQ